MLNVVNSTFNYDGMYCVCVCLECFAANKICRTKNKVDQIKMFIQKNGILSNDLCYCIKSTENERQHKQTGNRPDETQHNICAGNVIESSKGFHYQMNEIDTFVAFFFKN